MASDNWPSPCVLCGYNGPGFHSPETHPCAEWETERDALLGEIDRLNRVVDAVKRDLGNARSELVGVAQQLELEREASAQLRAEVGERMQETAMAQRDACAEYAARVNAHRGTLYGGEFAVSVRATPLVTHPSKHAPECKWHKDWHACDCGKFDRELAK